MGRSYCIRERSWGWMRTSVGSNKQRMVTTVDGPLVCRSSGQYVISMVWFLKDGAAGQYTDIMWCSWALPRYLRKWFDARWLSEWGQPHQGWWPSPLKIDLKLETSARQLDSRPMCSIKVFRAIRQTSESYSTAVRSIAYILFYISKYLISNE